MKREINCFWFDVLLSWAHQIWFRLCCLQGKQQKLQLLIGAVTKKTRIMCYLKFSFFSKYESALCYLFFLLAVLTFYSKKLEGVFSNWSVSIDKKNEYPFSFSLLQDLVNTTFGYGWASRTIPYIWLKGWLFVSSLRDSLVNISPHLSQL